MSENVGDVYLVQQMSGAPIEDGEGVRAVMLHIDARLNHSTQETQITYVLRLRDVVELLSGILGAGNVAFGHDDLQRAMADHLGVPKDLRDSSIAAVNDALDRELYS